MAIQQPSARKPPPDPIDEPARFNELSPAKQELVVAWIRSVMKPAKTQGRVTSYGFKHFCEQEVGFYVCNGAMKGAMLAAGYSPTNPSEQNTCYRVRPLQHPKRKRTSAGLWGREVYTIADADPITQQEFLRLREAFRRQDEG